MRKAIIYTRVSTSKQGVSGLGLEAQISVAESFCQNNYEIIEHYQEVVSGGKNDRLMIQKALNRCVITGATLVVAKLDRISRDVEFIAALQKSGVKFVCADMPEATESMIQFMSVFAQYERKMASERTKAALAEVKKKGIKLGSPENLRNQKLGSEKGALTRTKKATDYALLIKPEVELARASGCTSLRSIALFLNDKHIKTSRGNQWRVSSVKRLVERLGQPQTLLNSDQLVTQTR